MPPLFVLILCLLTCIPMHAQRHDRQHLSWEDFATLMHENYDDDDDPDHELYERLYELHTQPLNINRATIDDLQQLPFLSVVQISDLITYRDRNVPLRSLGELALVPSIDYHTRQMLMLFVHVGDADKGATTLRDYLRQAQNEVALRTDVPLYIKAGYQDLPDSVLASSPNKAYRGSRLYHSLRYSFASHDRLFLGLQMEKDPGERGIDHLSAYAMVRNVGRVRSAIVGNYRLSFGHGLVMNSGMSMGKSAMGSSMDRMDRGISRHSSTSESGYFTGAAATLSLGKALVTAYASYRHADGTYNADSTGITSLKTDGYHRTPLEHSKRGNIMVLDYGANIHLQTTPRWQLSASAVATHYSVPLAPKCDTPSSYYRAYNPTGQDFQAFSLAYKYAHGNVTASGEAAYSSSGGWATLHSLMLILPHNHNLQLTYRYYGARYNAIHGRSFGENSAVQNEQGVCLAWQNNMSRRLKLSAYIDAMYFPWMKYQVSGSSRGLDAQLQALYTASSRSTFIVRYRYKTKEKDYMADATSKASELRFRQSHTLRLQHTFALSHSLSLRTTASGSLIQFSDADKGFSFAELIRFTPSDWLSADLSFTYFNTDSYESRLTSYEPSLPYTFGMTTFYGRGTRTALRATLSLPCRLTLCLKGAATWYADRDAIGTGTEMIDSHHREDIQLQVRYKF